MIMIDKFIAGLFLGFILGVIFMIGLATYLNNRNKE